MATSHLIVIGSSVAGLMAAAAASSGFERVTFYERDLLPGGPQPRGGVPQGTQVHVILPWGLELMEAVLPGIRREFLAEGCLEFDQLAEVPTMSETGWKLRVPSVTAVAFRRPLFEYVIRRQVLALDNVTVQHASVRGLVLDQDGATVTGVRLRDGSVVEADFVIDASGRRSKSSEWLRELGYQEPVEVRADAFMGYATQFVQIPAGVLDDVRGLISHPVPGHHKGGVLLPADNGVHQLSAVGMMRDYPPRDRQGFLDFLDQARSPLLGEVARRCVPVSEIKTYHQDGNLRRRWEETKVPARFLVLGDAVASFNPIYGQGMTLASAGADLLLKALRGDTTLDDLGLEVQQRLALVVDTAFSMSGEVDSMFEGSVCSNFEVPSTEERRYAEAVDQLTTVDPEVALAVGMAAFWVDPQALTTDAMRLKVKNWLAGDHEPGGLDARSYPPDVTEVATEQIHQLVGADPFGKDES